MGSKTRTIRGEDYTPVVCKVIGRDQHGRPRQLETLYDEESTKLAGGEEFVIGFFKSRSVARSAS